MKMTTVHEILVPGVVLLLVVGVWSAAVETAVSAGGPIQFQLSDGDNVTCKPLGEQPSLQGNISWNPYPSTTILPGNSTYHTHGVKRAYQTIASDAGGCPDGTYPERQIPAYLLTNTSAATKKPFERPQGAQDDEPAPHEHIVGYLDESMTDSTGFKGTEAFINLWKPYVEGKKGYDEEFSLAQLWLISELSELNTIEVGWQVFPYLYGDNLPRLFVYWTADGYNNTGCYNLYCPGFVQVSNTVLVGGSFEPLSHQMKQQYEIKFRVFKDDDGTGDWWLQLNDENVGYWPKDLFNSLNDSATSIEWGGEIVDNYAAIGGNHTHTQMGSGQFADKGFGRAAYQRNLQYINEDKTLIDAPFEGLSDDTRPGCYTFKRGQDFSSWRSYFFFGGEGYNSNCTAPPS